MVRITGNLEVDYVLTVAVGLIYSIITNTFFIIKKFLIDYPDIAGPVFIILGAIVLYYIIKNAVAIIYGLIITLLKMVLVFIVLSLGLWIHVRGIEAFQNDFKTIVDFATDLKYDQDQTVGIIESYSSRVKESLSLFKDLNFYREG